MDQQENKKIIITESGLLKDVGRNPKLRYDLIPIEILTELAEHYTNSLKKYPENNWKQSTKSESNKIYIPAMWRHFIGFLRGDTNENHPIALIWNIIAWIWINKYKK